MIRDPARILLIEADPRAALLLGEMLRAYWNERLVLIHAANLSDATQELIDHGATCMLFGLAGDVADPLAPVEQLRGACPTAALVILGHEADEDLVEQLLRAGAQDFLARPDIHPRLLGRTIRYAIQRKRSEVALTELALHDSLTGLPNRALFLDRLGVALDRARRTGAAIAVLFLDVDNFKEINDTLGHSVGDNVLSGLARRLRAMLRPMDTIARFGGDELTLLFEELTVEREVVMIAERISRSAALPIRIDGHEVEVSVSIGVATVVDPNTPPETVIREADTAMYRAKELGRSRYELFDDVSRARAMERLEMEAALTHAVEREELRVHYQPKVSLRGGLGVVGFEALVRWQHPERGLLAPGEFLPLAEETGTVLRIGEFVLADALRYLRRWLEIRPGLSVSVNLSARQLDDAGLASMVAGQMADAGVEAAAVYLEVSEASVTRNPEAAARAVQGLKSIGVKVAVDDFGAGNASLQELRRLPLDALKIHESFVETLDQPGQSAVVSALVDLGHALGMGVAAEGVETEVQLAQLQAVGCDDAQGYFLGRPVPGEEVGALLKPPSR